MDIKKNHIFGSYRNEKEAIEAVEAIKNDLDKPIVSSESGYNFEVEEKNKRFPVNSFSPGKLDMGESAFKDYEDSPPNEEAPLEGNHRKPERPMLDQEMNIRIR